MTPDTQETSMTRISDTLHCAVSRRTVLGALASTLPLVGYADTYPSRSVKVIVTNAPGSLTDVVARQVLGPMQKITGQSFVVDNVVGAGGIVGTESVVRAAPDGYTLGMVPSTHAMLPALYKLSYDPVKSITPISIVGSSALILCVSPKITSKTPQEFFALSKSRAEGVTIGSPGVGTAIHIASEMMAAQTGMKWLHVPYKANSGLTTDLLGGQVDAAFLGGASAMPLVKSGKLRAIAVSGHNRLGPLPDVPTLSESGLPGFNIDAWVAVIGPANLPSAVVTRLHQDLQKALAEKSVQDYLRDQSVEVINTTPAQALDIFTKDIAKYAKVVKDGNIKGAS